MEPPPKFKPNQDLKLTVPEIRKILSLMRGQHDPPNRKCSRSRATAVSAICR